jgi:hypothetical protein
MEPTSIVIALLMMINNEIKEHRIQPSMSECLKGKRQAERTKQNNVSYSCIRTKAELEENIDGSKTIKKIILD